VIPELLGVPVAGALLLLAADLADEAVDIDHQRSLSGAGARLPRPRERDIEDSVELADMPERERTQKRPERGRRHHPVPEDQARAPGSEHVHVIDAVRPGEHPVHQRHHLTARQARSRRPGVEPHRLVHQLLDPQPLRERRGHQQSGVADEPLLVELHLHRLKARRPRRNVRRVMHHMGDLLVQARRRRIRQLSACSGGHLNLTIGRNGRRYAVDPG